MNKYIVIKDYQSCYPDPIVLKKDEEVVYGKEDTQYPNWIFCKSVTSEKEGWVPKQILTLPDLYSHAKVLQDYSAHELTVKKGELLRGFKNLNDWTYCETSAGEKGWIPTDHIAINR
ncbi:SH3 domain-containing protein [Sporolactobacillus laevolacticus]|uniref:SH3 domain-containing protein n=1 Tax=Sporolactobacillus laevolacticus TaxID=33018 RepID=UPI0025B5C80D|nr:SH3 domain-containing protein [Sporolactobacillus laevolacticus]MDN3954977.1 SH3 domain-containing protein [Sporolactobacillus laevolacticus]